MNIFFTSAAGNHTTLKHISSVTIHAHTSSFIYNFNCAINRQSAKAIQWKNTAFLPER
tara:strand:- start:4451 stop:4624 length:174 start_codon:yes stop_codon:yes gene_type:complete